MEVIFLPTDTDEDETESACLPSEDQDWQDPATYSSPNTDTGHWRLKIELIEVHDYYNWVKDISKSLNTKLRDIRHHSNCMPTPRHRHLPGKKPFLVRPGASSLVKHVFSRLVVLISLTTDALISISTLNSQFEIKDESWAQFCNFFVFYHSFG